MNTMCGVAGLLDRTLETGGEALQAAVTGMTGTLLHRGPDDGGVWADAASGVALGHRRLSILDLSPWGHQPMLSRDGQRVITYNGEIYNFPELRRELEARGHTFRGTSDTEVMLAAFEEWDVVEATRRFNGMFAFGLWDRARRTLYLARDRAGKKPLYYGWAGPVFLFASELKALRAHPAFRPEIDRDAAGLFLRYGYVPGPYSIYRGIRKLPPATILTVRATDRGTCADPVPYWSAAECAEAGLNHPLRGGEQEILNELRELVLDSTRRRMISDVPLGAFLSGGIDSSIVVASMQAVSPRPVKTFSIGFREQTHDEAPYAREVARALGTDHTELYVTAEEAMAVIPMLPAMYDEPFADSSQIPTYLVSRMARERVTVSLSGDGGDELFAGYQAYASNARGWAKYERLPSFLRPALGRALRSAGGMLDRAGLERTGLALQRRTREGIYGDLIAHWTDPRRIVRGAASARTPLSDGGCQARVEGFVQTMMYLDLVTYLPDDVLVKVDRASMAVSLEVRCPLLDVRVIEFAWRVPLALKMRDAQGKWLLRQLAYRLVPRELLDRPKAGFAVPVGEWLRGPLRGWAEELLDPHRLREDGLFEPAPVLRRWSQHLSGVPGCTPDLWDVLMFQAWRESLRAAVPPSRNPQVAVQ